VAWNDYPLGTIDKDAVAATLADELERCAGGPRSLAKSSEEVVSFHSLSLWRWTNQVHLARQPVDNVDLEGQGRTTAARRRTLRAAVREWGQAVGGWPPSPSTTVSGVPSSSRSTMVMSTLPSPSVSNWNRSALPSPSVVASGLDDFLRLAHGLSPLLAGPAEQAD
jgi:hypothetical protein